MIKSLSTGVRFDGIHSYYDYGWILVKQPKHTLPEPRIISVEVPGKDGVLDATESALGGLTYGNRAIDLDFRVTNDDATEQLRYMSKFLRDSYGRKKRIVTDEEPGVYYYGRCTIIPDSIERDGKMIDFTVHCDCEPYKYDQKPAHYEEGWQTNTISRVRSIISNYAFSPGMWGNYVELKFGSKTEPTGFFSQYSVLTLKWKAQEVTRSQYAYIEYMQGDTVKSERVEFPAGATSFALPRYDNVYRILVYGTGARVPDDIKITGDIHAYAIVTVQCGDNHAVPTVTSDAGGLKMVIGSTAYDINEGENEFPEIDMSGGEEMTIVFAGGSPTKQNGIISIDFERGWL